MSRGGACLLPLLGACLLPSPVSRLAFRVSRLPSRVSRLTSPVLLLASSVSLLLAVDTASAAPSPPPPPPARSATLEKVLARLMAHPTNKDERRKDRIVYVLQVPAFLMSDLQNCSGPRNTPPPEELYVATVSLTDRAPFALRPEQLGPEDFFIVELFHAASPHLFWRIRDEGVKGPVKPPGLDTVPFFQRDEQDFYHDYLEHIAVALGLEREGKR